jgi:O-antigen ligase
MWLACVYVAYCLLTLVWTWNVEMTVGRVITLSGLAIALPCLAASLPRSPTPTITVLVLSFAVTGVLSILDQLGNPGLVRVAVAGFDPNDFSGYLSMATAAGLVLGMRGHGWPRVAAWLSIPIFVVATLLTGSRMGTLALAVAIVAGVVVGSRRKWLGAVAAGVAILLATTLASALAFLPSTGRSLSVLEGVNLADTSQRDVIWESVLSAVDRWAVSGVGAGASRALVESTLGQAQVVHNVWLSVASETGLIGLALFVSMIGFALRAADASPYRLYCFATAPALLVTSLALSWEYRKVLWLWIALAIVSYGKTQVSERGLGGWTDEAKPWRVGKSGPSERGLRNPHTIVPDCIDEVPKQSPLECMRQRRPVVQPFAGQREGKWRR